MTNNYSIEASCGLSLSLTLWCTHRHITTQIFICLWVYIMQMTKFMWLFKNKLCDISAVYGSCPSGWTSYNGSGTYCVKKFYYKKTWFEARSSCRSYGAELVTVVSYGESSFMKGYLRHTGMYFRTKISGNNHINILKITILESENSIMYYNI